MGNISSKTIDNLPSNTIAVNKDATNGIHNKLTQSQSQTQLRLDSGKAGRQSWSSQSVRLHSVASKSWCNISTRSEKLQSTSLGSLSFKNSRKGSWPIPQTESLFLPHFKIYEGDIERQYTIVGLLERGAYGKVYEIIEKDTKEKFALKILSKAKIINEGSIRQIKDEVDIQTLCGHHPFIVQCHSFWQNRINIYLLAELIPRGELFKAITKFTYELVRLYVAELAIALDFLHNAGVIYRDLKPENILVDADYHLKITDFGFSKWLKIGNRTNTICGTTKYMGNYYI